MATVKKLCDLLQRFAFLPAIPHHCLVGFGVMNPSFTDHSATLLISPRDSSVLHRPIESATHSSYFSSPAGIAQISTQLWSIRGDYPNRNTTFSRYALRLAVAGALSSLYSGHRDIHPHQSMIGTRKWKVSDQTKQRVIASWPEDACIVDPK